MKIKKALFYNKIPNKNQKKKNNQYDRKNYKK